MEKCYKEKEIYDKCFIKWYRYSFIKGELTGLCNTEWENYKICIKEELQRKDLYKLRDFVWFKPEEKKEDSMEYNKAIT